MACYLNGLDEREGSDLTKVNIPILIHNSCNHALRIYCTVKGPPHDIYIFGKLQSTSVRQLPTSQFFVLDARY
jgi:hypothetical protein